MRDPGGRVTAVERIQEATLEINELTHTLQSGSGTQGRKSPSGPRKSNDQKDVESAYLT